MESMTYEYNGLIYELHASSKGVYIYKNTKANKYLIVSNNEVLFTINDSNYGPIQIYQAV